MEQQSADADRLNLAAARLLAGGLVAIPTETVYGLAADATNPQAVARVFAIKGRPVDHPLIVHCRSAEQAWKCAARVGPAARKLAAAFWPGPLTLVLPRAETIDPRVTGGQDSVALRVPSHRLTLELLRLVDRPLVAPSANRFGRVSPTTADHVRDEFSEADVLVLDGGPCPVGIESTIVDCRDDHPLRILRPGKITSAEIEQVAGSLDPVSHPPAVDRPRVSGSLPAHYAPRARVLLIEPGETTCWLAQASDSAPPTLLLTPLPPEDLHPDWLEWHQVSAEPEVFASEMYALLRRADQRGFSRVAIELPVAAGIGQAIRDRLKRAAASS